MPTAILQSMGSRQKRCCQPHKFPANYYCIRCNWRGDTPEDPRQGEIWHSCPVCRGHALPRARCHGR